MTASPDQGYPPHVEPATSDLVTVTDLVKHYPVRANEWRKTTARVKAVDGVSLAVRNGETLGLVGESGSGKTTLGRVMLRLVEATAGQVHFDGQDVLGADRQTLKALRGDMQMIFQDPHSALDPRITVGASVAEGLRIQRTFTQPELRGAVNTLLDMVGLATHHATKYPHEFSGGQLQRVGIARALALEPRFVVCDEPVSALDVSIQAQIVNLLSDLQSRLGLTYLFIAHDLSVVEHIADRVAVMYLGKVVEMGGKRDLYRDPKHPYTQALLSAVPQHDAEKRRQRIVLGGEIPSSVDPPSGCGFRIRCPYATDQCRETPPLNEVVPGHWTACWLFK